MKVWIERCKQSGHGISWEVVASLVKETHDNGDRNLAEREILINHSKYFILQITF